MQGADAGTPREGLRRYEHFLIGGEWVLPDSAERVESVDPTTETVWASIPVANPEDVDRAVSAAKEALNGEWGRISPTDRGRMIAALAAQLRANASSLAELETKDNGKPIRDTRAEVARAADWLDFYAGAADKINGESIPYRKGAHAYTIREPIGVVAAITPWNSPISMYSWKLGPALAAGNTVVLKPSQLTSVTALELGELTRKVGLPPGVVNIVTGPGSTTGDALVSHAGVDKVAFTGEHATAQAILRATAPRMARTTFELGGKSPHIVFSDANLERALTVATHAAFRSTGQSCSAGSRLLLQRDIYDRFIERLVAKTAQIRVGVPLDERTHLGPQSSAKQLEKTLAYVQQARTEGARLVAGGGRPAALSSGFFVEPTIFADVNNRSQLAQEEVFGPVLAVIPFDDEDEAISLANDVHYGLVAGIWTENIGRAHRVAAAIKAGFVSVNTYRPVHYMLPYGGYKSSGLGRENGLEVLREYTELKTVVVELADQDPPDPFAD